MQAFGVNVPRMVTLTYGFGVALAAFGGVLAAPIYSVNPQMGANLIIVVFAVVVIGGMGSILGSILTGFGLGIVEGLTKVFWPGSLGHRHFRHHGDRAAAHVPPASSGGPEHGRHHQHRRAAPSRRRQRNRGVWVSPGRSSWRSWPGHLPGGSPFVLYPVFLMKLLCFALFACAFNLLIGYVGLLSLRPCRLFRHGRLSRRPRSQGLGSDAGARDHHRRLSPPARSALVAGSLAIRRQGIYFAMITLALAQMVYFFCVQAPFTGGEDGIQSVPRGNLLGIFPLDRRSHACIGWSPASSWPASC